MVVDSDPVPAVVGTAISGLSGSRGALPAPIGGVTKSSSSPGCVVSRLTALAVSMDDPPPTATPSSSRAPMPNFNGGAAHVNTLSLRGTSGSDGIPDIDMRFHGTQFG